MKKISTAIICNNRMAIPAIQQLAWMNSLAAVAVPVQNADLYNDCCHLLNGTKIPVISLDKSSLYNDLESFIIDFKPGAIWVMTFPWKIPGALLKKFPDLFFNFHYGILPSVRGVDPVFESIRNQKDEAGITVHLVTEEMDKGPVVFQQKIPLDEHTTHGLLCTRLGVLGAQMSEVLVPMFADKENLVFHPQEEKNANYYSKPGLKEVAINWKMMDSKEIHALARACNPWNKGAYTSVKGWNIRICGLSYSDTGKEDVPAGTIIHADNSNGVVVACRDGRNLLIDAFYTDEGIFNGKKLIQFGIVKGDRLENII